MGRTFLLAAVLAAALATPIASSQTAFRCDVNGATVYSDKPCPPGSVTKAVTSTQETPEQKAASLAANQQMRKDSAELNKRLTEREKLEAKERADARKAASKLRADAAKEKAAKTRKGSKATKNKAPKKSSKTKAKSANSSASVKP